MYVLELLHVLFLIVKLNLFVPPTATTLLLALLQPHRFSGLVIVRVSLAARFVGQDVQVIAISV